MNSKETLRARLLAYGARRCDLGHLPDCGGHATEVHHRKLRSQGGPDTAENLVALCAKHHALVHKERLWAKSWGWIVPGWGDPETVHPVPPGGLDIRGPYRDAFDDLGEAS